MDEMFLYFKHSDTYKLVSVRNFPANKQLTIILCCYNFVSLICAVLLTLP